MAHLSNSGHSVRTSKGAVMLEIVLDIALIGLFLIMAILGFVLIMLGRGRR